MSDDIQNTIEVLIARISTKDEESNRLKKLVNELCGEAGVAIRYPSISEAGAAVSAIRSDQFYGLTLTAAIRNYLERRKSSNLGAASVNEIYKAIRDGGYKFESKNESNAKVSVGNALRNSSSIFHKLPNGNYGLLVWYPSAKAQPESATNGSGKVKQSKRGKKNVLDGNAGTNGEIVSNADIRDVILEQAGEFQAAAIEEAVKTKHQSKVLPKTKIATVIFLLKKKGLVKEVSARTGTKGAVYSKA